MSATQEGSETTDGLSCCGADAQGNGRNNGYNMMYFVAAALSGTIFTVVQKVKGNEGEGGAGNGCSSEAASTISWP